MINPLALNQYNPLLRDNNTQQYANYMASVNPPVSALATAVPVVPTANTAQGKLSNYENTLATMTANAKPFTPTPMGVGSTVIPITKRFPAPATNTTNTANTSKAKMTYNKNGKKGSGLGPSAYGFQGTTGQASLRGKGKYGLQSRFSDALGRMFTAMDLAGVGRPGVTDGFRSFAAQQDVKKRKGNLAATPGRSVHGLGLATDLDLNKTQLSWLRQNAGTYGIVNLPSESWHWQMSPDLWGGEWD